MKQGNKEVFSVPSIQDEPDISTARLLLNQTLEVFEKKVPKAMQVLERGPANVSGSPTES